MLLDKIIALFRYLPPSGRKSALWLAVNTLAMAIIEVVGISAMGPFMACVSDPRLIHSNPLASSAYVRFGFDSDIGFISALGAVVILVLVIRTIFCSYTTWYSFVFVHQQSYELARALLTRYLSQDFYWFSKQNAGVLCNRLFDEVIRVVQGILLPAVQFVSRVTTAVFILAAIVWMDPGIAFSAAIFLALAYSVVYSCTRGTLRVISPLRIEAIIRSFRVGTEALTAEKVIKIEGREEFFIQEFSRDCRFAQRTEATQRTIAEVPRYIMEAVGFCGIILIAMHLLAIGTDLGVVFTKLTVYAAAGYRLLPALQLAYSGLANARTNLPSLDNVLTDLALPLRPMVTTSETLSFQRELTLQDITFTYPEAERPSLRSLSLRIKCHSMIGFVGPSGAGKSTLVNILLGLIRPSSGTLLVDDAELTSATDIRRWQNIVGYVPQEIFLSDDTIMANIAFGLPPSQRDPAAVHLAAERAGIHTFISELPLGYETVVGNRGARLSGGQCQRIGIARALYKNPQVIVFDEATSSLDALTEEGIINSLESMRGERTVLLVAHRLSTVKNCDLIFEFENGQVKASGDFNQLVSCSPTFRAMAVAQQIPL